ncbi:RNA polymerase sigma factor [Engelhardtia mirabilis]|uniref:ECF RNA polymerase sigma factor SigW n=1 Tax=Engelhardtia mirabilis TaxID=2528011 RepID=A0A518BG61_9BACT|nr:ECF RNA polymerase sigma factor SigW [Planctomycetes bacterium Pla133]QDV00297.1 ECF RNA polymerase sigma factor SigW [Planctomycetes bacterium Pla86]
MSSAEYEQLLSQGAWVRDLARRLVRDPDLADDLAQEAWLAAARIRWSEVHSPRAWMATVLRRALRERLRGEERRALRERSSSRPEAVDADPADIVARAAAHQDVVEAVMQLPEHYRLVVLRRYFDGQSPEEIARATNVPVATVKTRLQRGLAALRERLDRKHGGDGRSWAVALAPLAWRGHEPFAVLSPAAIVAAATATVAAVVLALFFALRPPANLPAGANAPAATAALAEAPPTVVNSVPPGSEDARRRAVAVAPTEAGPVGTAARGLALDAGPRHPITADVRDLDGRPVAGVLVRFESERATSTAIALSDDQGRARLSTASPPGTLDCGDSAWAAVAPLRITELSERRVTLIVARRIERTGRAVDHFGVGVGAAELAFELPAPAGPGASEAVAARATTDPSGAFAFAAPDAPGAVIAVTAPGRETLRFPVAELGPMPWTLVLPSPGDLALRGRVFDGAGAPLAAARLALDGVLVPLAADGSFALTARSGELVAWAPGYASARTEIDADASAPIDLELLRAPDLVGVVRDRAGEPVPGALVWDSLAVPVLWDQDLGDVLWLSAEVGAAAAQAPVEFPSLGAAEVETGSGWKPVRADAAGRFVLHGDPSRARHLVALATESHDVGEFDLAAGLSFPCELILDEPARPGALEGRVIDSTGAPQRGVQVESMARVLSARCGTLQLEVGLVLERGARTDSAGLFQIDRPQPVGHLFQFIGERSLPRRVDSGLAQGPDAEMGRPLRGFELNVYRAVPLDLRGDWPAGTRLLAQGSEGNPLFMAHRRGRHVEWFRGSVPAELGPASLMGEPTLARIAVEGTGQFIDVLPEAVIEVSPAAIDRSR